MPAKIHIHESPDVVEKFRVKWTPAIVFLDADGNDHHRFVGYLPPREFVIQCDLARAKTAFDQGDYKEASKLFGHIAESYDRAEVAPEVMYWLGVSRYKETGSVDALMDIWGKLLEGYPNSEWATKASFLFPEE